MSKTRQNIFRQYSQLLKSFLTILKVFSYFFAEYINTIYCFIGYIKPKTEGTKYKVMLFYLKMRKEKRNEIKFR